MDAVKVASTLGINRCRHAKGPVWQPRYFDRIVRNVGEYHKTTEYMHLNPVRRGLVSQPEDWLWSSIHSYGGPGPIRLLVDRVILASEHRNLSEREGKRNGKAAGLQFEPCATIPLFR